MTIALRTASSRMRRFGDLGLPILALGGRASQTLCDTVHRDIERQGRPAVLIYAGDHDPAGDVMDEDFARRTGAFDTVVRVALSREQVTEYNLPTSITPKVYKKISDDPMAGRFEERYGDLLQVELDALTPETLRYLYQTAIDDYWDYRSYDDVLASEDEERERLAEICGSRPGSWPTFTA